MLSPLDAAHVRSMQLAVIGEPFLGKAVLYNASNQLLGITYNRTAESRALSTLNQLITLTVNLELKYVVFWRQEDSRWKWHIDIWNQNS